MDTTQFTRNGKFLMLALDHRGSFKKILNPTNEKGVTDEDMIEAKRQIIETMQDLFSGILIDTEYGLPAYKSTKPYLLAIEKTGYKDENGERITELEHSVAELKGKGASGVKILLYFNPRLPSAMKQIETAKQVLTECVQYDLPLFLEIVTYDVPGKEGNKSADILSSVEMFLKNGVRPHVFKLEYPGDIETCKKITAAAGQTPWILLTRGGKFDDFLSQLGDAVSQGAAGFLAGRSVWQEVGDYQGKERLSFLQTTAKDRFSRICKSVIQNSI